MRNVKWKLFGTALTMARNMIIKNSGELNPVLNPNGYDSSYIWEAWDIL